MLTTGEMITEALKSNACLFFSGGADSSLLLRLVLKQANIPLVTFAEDFTRGQRKRLEQIVFDHNLTLYTYPPRQRYFLPREGGFSLIDEYGFSGETIPVIRDVEDAETGCAAELSKRRFDSFDFGFDTVLTGALKTDAHFAAGKTPLRSAIHRQNNVLFVSPLWNWSKTKVSDEVKRENLPVIEDTGEIRVCAKCLAGEAFCHLENRIIPRVEWNPAENLRIFREKYGYEGEIL